MEGYEYFEKLKILSCGKLKILRKKKWKLKRWKKNYSGWFYVLKSIKEMYVLYVNKKRDSCMILFDKRKKRVFDYALCFSYVICCSLFYVVISPFFVFTSRWFVSVFFFDMVICLLYLQISYMVCVYCFFGILFYVSVYIAKDDNVLGVLMLIRFISLLIVYFDKK